MRPKTSCYLLQLYLNKQVLIKMTNIILSYTILPEKKRFLFSKNFRKLREQICMSSNQRFWFEIKWLVKQMLQLELKFNAYLPKFNAENSIWRHFILSGTNGFMRGKLLSFSLCGGRFTEVTTYFKYYWKHSLMQ